MNCRDIRIQLSGKMEQELNPALSLHLDGCPDCARFHLEEQRLDELLEVAGTVSLNPPTYLWNRIEARISAGLPTPVRVRVRVQGVRVQEGYARWLGSLFRVPALRPVWVGLLVAGIVTGGLLRLPAGEESATLLAELDAYRLETPENPFFTASIDDSNPFEMRSASVTQ